MALVKCAECGNQISGDATACPHCGKPRRPADHISNASGGCATALVIGVLSLVAMSYCGNHPSNAGKSAEPPELKGMISFNGIAFQLENKDDFDWSNCGLQVNSHGFDSGYEATIPLVKSRDSVTIAAMTLANSDGERLNPVTHKAKEIFIRCDTPAGKAYTGWALK
jgi:uncharacterized OB-fold protein